MSSAHNATTLHRLVPGHNTRVIQVIGDDSLSRRLSDLGLWPGTEIEVVRRAPFGDPTEYRLRGYRLALRSDEAARILVEAPWMPN